MLMRPEEFAVSEVSEQFEISDSIMRGGFGPENILLVIYIYRFEKCGNW